MKNLLLLILLTGCAPVHMEASFSFGENQVINKKTSIKHSDAAISDNFVQLGDTLDGLLQFINTFRLQRTESLPATRSGAERRCDEAGL